MNKKGFTLVEILVTTAIFAVIASFSIPFYSGWQSSSGISNYRAQIVENLELVRLRALSGLDNMSHGIYFDISENDADSFILFRGENYSSRDSSYDREFRIPKNIVLTTNLANSEIVFEKYTGLSQTTGQINLLNSYNAENCEILINGIAIPVYN